MIVYNSMGSEKVSYDVMDSSGFINFSIFPSTHKICVENIGAGDGDIKSVSIDVENPGKITKTKLAAAGALTSTYIDNDIISIGSFIKATTATFVAGTGLEVTLSNDVPGLIGAAVSLEFDGKLANTMALSLPKVLYVTSAGTKKITLGIEKFGGITVPANVSGVRVLSLSPVMKNLPVYITSVSVTNNIAVLTGSFPNDVTGSAIVFPSTSSFISKSFRNRGEGLEFEIKKIVGNKLTIMNTSGKLITLAQSDTGKLESGEIVTITGYSNNPINSGQLQSISLTARINGGTATTFKVNSNLKIIQKIRSA